MKFNGVRPPEILCSSWMWPRVYLHTHSQVGLSKKKKKSFPHFHLTQSTEHFLQVAQVHRVVTGIKKRWHVKKKKDPKRLIRLLGQEGVGSFIVSMGGEIRYWGFRGDGEGNWCWENRINYWLLRSGCWRRVIKEQGHAGKAGWKGSCGNMILGRRYLGADYYCTGFWVQLVWPYRPFAYDPLFEPNVSCHWRK